MKKKLITILPVLICIIGLLVFFNNSKNVKEPEWENLDYTGLYINFPPETIYLSQDSENSNLYHIPSINPDNGDLIFYLTENEKNGNGFKLQKGALVDITLNIAPGERGSHMVGYYDGNEFIYIYSETVEEIAEIHFEVPEDGIYYFFSQGMSATYLPITSGEILVH